MNDVLEDFGGDLVRLDEVLLQTGGADPAEGAEAQREDVTEVKQALNFKQIPPWDEGSRKAYFEGIANIFQIVKILTLITLI